MGDEVDQLVEAWNRERPDLDVEPLQVMSRLARVAELMAARRREAFARHELGAHEFDVLSALRRAGAPYQLTPGQLLEITHVTSGTMTHRLDQLTDRRLVSRRAHPDDGRQSLVRLTPAGRRRVDGALTTLLEIEHAALDGFDPARRAQLAKSMRVLLESLAAGESG